MEDSRIENVYSRSHQTKLKIASTLNMLCTVMDFSEVKVEEVARLACVSRSGFYYHFSDLNEVVTWLSQQCYARGIDRIGRTLTWLEGNLITTHCIHRYKDLFTKGGTSRDYSAGAPFFIRHRRQNLIETIVEYKGLEVTKTLAFQVEALPYLEMNMSNNFGDGKYELSVQEYAELLTSCVPRELFETLNVPVSPSSISDDMLSMLL